MMIGCNETALFDKILSGKPEWKQTAVNINQREIPFRLSRLMFGVVYVLFKCLFNNAIKRRTIRTNNKIDSKNTIFLTENIVIKLLPQTVCAIYRTTEWEEKQWGKVSDAHWFDTVK